MLRVPPVVLITVHEEGMHWSGRREEGRGDPRCLGGRRRLSRFTCMGHKSQTSSPLSVPLLPFLPS